MTMDALLSLLDGVRPRGTGKWSALCPAHQDNSPSLSIGEGTGRILLYCFALCENRDIVSALGLTMADLFFDAPPPHGQRPTPKSVRFDHIALAFRFELAAIDRRLRAERIVETGKKIDVASLNDAELDRALAFAAQAHGDVQRAELFECVADGLRMKEFLERNHEQTRRVA